MPRTRADGGLHSPSRQAAAHPGPNRGLYLDTKKPDPVTDRAHSVTARIGLVSQPIAHGLNRGRDFLGFGPWLASANDDFPFGIGNAGAKTVFADDLDEFVNHGRWIGLDTPILRIRYVLRKRKTRKKRTPFPGCAIRIGGASGCFGLAFPLIKNALSVHLRVTMEGFGNVGGPVKGHLRFRVLIERDELK